MAGSFEETFGQASDAVRRTPWTLISQAQKGQAGAREKAAERIYVLFAGAVQGFLSARGARPEEARELTQEFFTRLLERDFLSRLDPARGRLRHFLFASLRRFICDEADRRGAQKRGGAQGPVSLDTLRGELEAIEKDGRTDSPRDQFFRLWAVELLERALERMKHESAGTSREAWYRAVCLWHRIGPDSTEMTYDDLAGKLGVNSQQAANYLFRGRVRMRSLLLEELKSYCSNPEEVQEEVTELFQALGS